MLGMRLDRWEKFFYITILLLALFSRFYMLGTRAISHDESIHTKFSWNFYNDQSFQHNPMMHGPLLFEATALSYFLFGVSDFTSRIYVAVTGVLLVMTPILFRKWLGKKGAALATLMLLISPVISYYSRYIRHDAPIMLFAVLWIWTILRYIDDGEIRWLYWMAAFFSLMHATKEVNYIYAAIVCGLLALPFMWQVTTVRWKRPNLFVFFAIAVIAALLFAGLFLVSTRGAEVELHNLDEAGNTRVTNVTIPVWGLVMAGGALLMSLGALFLLYYGVGEEQMAQIRLFAVLMAVGTLLLPLASALLISLVGIDMTVVYEAVRTGSFSTLPSSTVWGIFTVVVLSLVVSAILGLWWNRAHWLGIALVHYAIFFVTYSSVFTWGWGILSGLVGSLSYWMAQQGVERGSQPGYYYALVGSMYEFLPLLLSIPAGVGSLLYAIRARVVPAETSKAGSGSADYPVVFQDSERYFPVFLAGWTLLAWLAYTYAGEKMPWLLVHIVLPSILLASWWLGRLLDSLDLAELWASGLMERLRLLLFPVSLVLFVAVLVVWAGRAGDLRRSMADGVSTAGPTLSQLDPFGRVLGSLLSAGVFGAVLFWSASKLGMKRIGRFGVLTLAVFLAVLTARTMLIFNFVTYDMASELLVYAHGTPDIKVAMQQVQDISWRVTGSAHEVKVAYSEDGSWPMTWYMVNYPNNYFFSRTPDAGTLLDCPVAVVGSEQYSAVDDIFGDKEYVYFDYKYLWWPIEDYKNLTLERLRNALSNPEMRRALWDIFWKRDYVRYATLKNPAAPFTFETWPYRREFRLYVRKDLAYDVWGDLAVEAASLVVPKATQVPDPYAAGGRALSLASTAVLANSAPRGLAIAPDGTLYVADTAQHLVWHITPQGVVLGTLGGYGIEPGQFNEPWGVAIDAGGNVYVTDTWNHRVQKFDANGNYLTSWGTLAQSGAFDQTGQGAFFGPRGIAISVDGEVYVTDTGNKRVQVFTPDGEFLREFGGVGTSAGKLDEPVGIAVSDDGRVAVADMWNLRMQVFTSVGEPLLQWDMPGWRVDNPEEKAFVTISGETLYVSDPTNRRVLAFTLEGTFEWSLSADLSGAALLYPVGVAVFDDVLYVADAHTAQVLGYRLSD